MLSSGQVEGQHRQRLKLCSELCYADHLVCSKLLLLCNVVHDYCCRWNYELRDDGNCMGTAGIEFDNLIGMEMNVNAVGNG